MSEGELNYAKYKYSKGPDVLRTLAEHASELKVPQETVEKWKKFFPSISIVDYRIDNAPHPKERAQLARDISDFLQGRQVDFAADGEMEKALLDLRGLYEGLSQEKQEYFLRTLKMILDVTESVKQEKDVAQFTKLRMLEGQLISKIVLTFLPDEYVQSPEYRKLMQTCVHIGRAVNVLDSFVDSPEDYERGQTRIEPTPLHRAALLGAALSEGAKGLSGLRMSRELMRQGLYAGNRVLRDKKGFRGSMGKTE